MYNELDNYIKFYEDDNTSTNCYWEETGHEEASQMMDRFTDNEWNDLFSNLSSKSNIWKKRLVYAMYNCPDDIKIKTALKLINTNDIELFELLLVRIMNCDFSELNNKNDFINKIKQFNNTQSRITQNIFLSFLKKINENVENSKKI